MKPLGLAALLLLGSAIAGHCAGYDDLNTGIEAFNRGNMNVAIRQLGDALGANDLIADQQFVAHLDRSRAYAALGDMEHAIGELSACLQLRPDDRTALLDRAHLYMTTNKADLARQDADTLVAGDPDIEEFVLLRSSTYDMQGNAAKALEDLQRIQSGNPNARNDTQIALAIGIAYYQLGRADDAAQVFTGLLNINATAWLWLAITDAKLGKSLPDVPTAMASDRWPFPLVAYFQGQATEEYVLEAARQGGPQQLCDADLYLGEWRQLHNGNAKPLFRQAAHDCPPGSMNWNAAQEELSHGS